MTTEDTNKLIKEVAFDIISITTMWGLVISSHLSFDNYYFFNENKYRSFSVSFQNITKFVALGSSAIVLTKYFPR
jgi:hypothetical protein